jgi:hypothetical protein
MVASATERALGDVISTRKIARTLDGRADGCDANQSLAHLGPKSRRLERRYCAATVRN